jgi:outer membrane lipoprotein-sorting protein
VSVLRRISTARLLALCATVVAAIAGGTAIATALDSAGPVPPPRHLADAVHRALLAPAQQGVSADVQLTNHLVDTSLLHTHNPLLDGAAGRVWLSRDNGLRLELKSDRGDSELVVSHGSFSFYDASSNTVYRGQLPSGAGAKGAKGAKEAARPRAEKTSDKGHVPSIADIQKAILPLTKRAKLGDPSPGTVANQPAYTVRVAPRHDGGLLGALELGWDANHGVPLRFAVYAQGNGDPVLELKATNITFGPVPASDINVAPPSDAKVVQVGGAQDAKAKAKAQAKGHRGRADKHAAGSTVSGLAAVQARLPFRLSAPHQLVGLPRQSVHLLSYQGHPGALVTYGQGLGAIAVVERENVADKPGAKAASKPAPRGDGETQGASLPTVSINGATGQEIPTALGTLLSFHKKLQGHDVSFTVLGSIPANAAEAAARAL